MVKLYFYSLFRLLVPLAATCCFVASSHMASAQDQKVVDGKVYKKYKPSYFKPKRGLQYNLYISPVLTVDPLGIGGKSTYALSIGSRINLWESKSINNNLQGLRIQGLYMGFGYELYPKQYDNIYGSLWLRIKTFMPITARLDAVYSFGYGLRGVGTRYCFGFEVKRFTVLLSGTIAPYEHPVFGYHPHTESPYGNVGAVMLVIPFYNHYPAAK